MEDIQEKFNHLGDPLRSEAIQRTQDWQTHKGYDTDGYGYQFCVNRFNEVFGNQWGCSFDIIHEATSSSKSGNTMYDITTKVSIWVINPDQPRSCAGSHRSKTYGDALKGAITNGFKKTAAFWGVGRQAYEGALDDDNDPWPEFAAQNGSEPSSSSPEAITESFHEKPAQQARQSETPAPPKNGNGHNSSQQNGQAAPPAGNRQEDRLRKRIDGRLKALFAGSEEKIDAWFRSKSKTVKCLGDLDSLNLTTLSAIYDEVDKLVKSLSASN